ncbi:MAG: prepilin-type N-terminal cleavage/methylation domain-containing protein [Acidimicrobiales bacterium]
MTATFRRRPRNRSGAQAGFTLIELLVVITILGILSAVVVFAVRGSGDKGKAAAVATDARTIRTAQEAYCAKAGHYGTMRQLTGKDPANGTTDKYRFLSEESEYHKVETGGDALVGGQGSCPGQPSRYTLDCKDGSAPPNCGAPIPSGPPLGKGKWTATGDLPHFSGQYWDMVAMDGSGKVVIIGENDRLSLTPPFPIMSYDAMGEQWSNSTVLIPDGIKNAVAVPGEPTAECPRCGKVLVQTRVQGYEMRGLEWLLYDPYKDRLEQLPASVNPLCYSTRLIPLGDGTLLKVGCDERDYGRLAELFDPRTPGGSSPWRAVANMPQPHKFPVSVRLEDDRVLVVGGGPPPVGEPQGRWESNFASIYDPVSGAWTIAASSKFDHNIVDSAVLLRDGRVLVMNGSKSELYNPDEDKWIPVTGCPCPTLLAGTGSGGILDHGYAFGLLPSGRVLIAGIYNENSSGSSPKYNLATLFDPLTDTWSPAETMPASKEYAEAKILAGRDCGNSCGKLIVAGGSSTTFEETLLFDENG